MADTRDYSTDMSKVLGDKTIIQLDVTIWTGRAKLRLDDLPDVDTAALPPEALATLGSKRLINGDTLRIFGALRAQAINALDMNGVRFLGGWLVGSTVVDSVVDELKRIKADFGKAIQVFVANYRSHAEMWMDDYPEWRAMIAKALPSEAAIGSRFHFDYTAFTIDLPTVAGAKLKTKIQGLGSQAMSEIRQMVMRTYKESFMGKSTVTRRALRPCRTIMDKLNAVSYLAGGLELAADEFQDALHTVENQTDNEVAVKNFKTFLLSFGNLETLDAMLSERETSETSDGEPAEDTSSDSETPEPLSPQSERSELEDALGL